MNLMQIPFGLFGVVVFSTCVFINYHYMHLLRWCGVEGELQTAAWAASALTFGSISMLLMMKLLGLSKKG